MITWTETVTKSDGTVKVDKKEFTSLSSFKKAVDKSPLSSMVKYELKKKHKTQIVYDDATVDIDISGFLTAVE